MNPNELMEKLGLTAEEMAELVALFVDSCGNDLDRMSTALEAGDARSLSEAAHSIKGAAGNMRFERVYDLARGIEEDARRRDLDDIGARIAQIRAVVAQIEQEFGDDTF